MIDFTAKRSTVVKGLRDYLNIPVIRSNQNEAPPSYPYISYTITTLASENNGTWGEYSDEKERKPFTQTWSITVQSDDVEEAMKYALMAREWLDHIGMVYLNDNGVIVHSVGGITNRDNILTVEYEYRNGFDVVFWFMSEIESTTEAAGVIDEVALNEKVIVQTQDIDELNALLEQRLGGEG